MRLKDFYRNYTTKQHSLWWQKRRVDWSKDYLSTWKHPHRYFISAILKTFSWLSLIEVGCGGGANLVNILKNFQNRQVGGTDINQEAIALVQKTFTGGLFKVGSSDNILLSDKSTDVVLSDMHLIYVGPTKINDYLKEMKRITRNRLVLCEFHSQSFWQRLKLRVTTGYHAYNYQKLLQKHGFYDIIGYKIPSEVWPDTPQLSNFRYVFVAKRPPRG